jgi:hypothetical protein
VANTAQANQPLSQHPLPWAMHRILGGGGSLFKGALPNSDVLVVPPPAPSPNGEVKRAVDYFALANLFNNTGPGILASVLPVANFQLIYKDGDGNEVILNESALALAANGTVVIAPNFNFLLNSDDQGVFLRIGDLQEAGPVPFTGSIDGHVSFTDTRDMARVETDLTTEFQTVLGGVQGRARFLSPLGASGLPTPAYGGFLNFDNIDHTIQARLTDGVNTIVLPGFEASSPVLAGQSFNLSSNNIAFLEGWALQMRTTVAAAVAPMRVMMMYTDTNLSPVRDNQAGAY